MIKVGLADYGVVAWEGAFYDYMERMEMVKRAGCDGIERLYAQSADQALSLAARVHAMGMDFTTVRGPAADLSMQWIAALGKPYMWAEMGAKDFDTLCRQVNIQAAHCKRWGIRVALHNHLGSPVETQEQLLRFLENCPDCQLVLDTGHLAVAKGGDPAAIVRGHFRRLAAVHVKDWVSTDPAAERWHDQGYFTGLGRGNTPVGNDEVIRLLLALDYDGWVFVEHDTHLRQPELDLTESRQYLKKLGI